MASLSLGEKVSNFVFYAQSTPGEKTQMNAIMLKCILHINRLSIFYFIFNVLIRTCSYVLIRSEKTIEMCNKNSFIFHFYKRARVRACVRACVCVFACFCVSKVTTLR